MGKKSQSGMITAVILIVLVLAGIVIVWNIVMPMLNKYGNQAEDKSKVFSISLFVESVNLVGEIREVRVKRASGSENISKINFIFKDEYGHVIIANKSTNLPRELETRSFYFSANDLKGSSKIVEVTVVPVIGNTLGMEFKSENKIIDNKSLFDNLNAETGTTAGWTGFSGVSNDALGGSYAFYSIGSVTVSSDFFEVDSSKSYYEEGWFKSTGAGGSLSRLYFGFIPYDQNKKFIGHENVNYYANTETTLFQDCIDTDRSVYINKIGGSCGGWIPYLYGFMAFNIDNSGSYSDLPNFILTPYNITKVENLGTSCNITFFNPIGKTYPAGTKVREHFSGGTYQYTSAGGVLVPTTWTRYSSTMTGVSNIGQEPNKFRKGTRFVKLMMLLNYAQVNNRTEIDNITFKMV